MHDKKTALQFFKTKDNNEVSLLYQTENETENYGDFIKTNLASP